MTGKIARSIRHGPEDAVAFTEGTADPRHLRVLVPPEIDVRAVRAKLGLTQQAFAGRFAFSIKTLRQWEQKQRVPDGPARAYLLVIDRDPKAVERALRRAG